MIALALARDSSIILCDESTSSLDRENKANIFAILKKLAYEFNKMVIIVSHDADIYKQCDLVYEIDNKEIKLKTNEVNIFSEPAVKLRKNQPNETVLHYIIKSRLNKNKQSYILTSLLTAFMVMLLIMGK